MSRIADAVRTVIGESLLRPGDTELDLAHRYTAVAELTAPLTGPALEYAFNHHLRDSIRNDVIDRTALATGRLNTGSEVTVAFADLVGFTRLGEELPPERLGGVVDRLGELAAEVAQRPVQLVKMIGDAAMLVSPEPAALLDATLTLVAAQRGAGRRLPGPARGRGLGHGADPRRRLVRAAGQPGQPHHEHRPPGSVLTSREVRDAVGEDGYRWSFAGDRKLKGVRGDTRVYRVRPDDNGSSSP